jgi:hypothetical protein
MPYGGLCVFLETTEMSRLGQNNPELYDLRDWRENVFHSSLKL